MGAESSPLETPRFARLSESFFGLTYYSKDQQLKTQYGDNVLAEMDDPDCLGECVA